MLPKPVIIAGCCIFLFHALPNIGYENQFYKNVSPIVKHGINFSMLLAVALAGHLGLRSLRQPWINTLWVRSYAVVLTLLLLLGLIDLLSRFDNQNFRDFAGYFKMFFTSPLPFAVAVIFTLASARSR